MVWSFLDALFDSSYWNIFICYGAGASFVFLISLYALIYYLRCFSLSDAFFDSVLIGQFS